MIVFKGCAKCAGDLFVERDVGETDLVCLQCGYRKPVRSWVDDAIERRRDLSRLEEFGKVGV